MPKEKKMIPLGGIRDDERNWRILNNRLSRFFKMLISHRILNIRIKMYTYICRYLENNDILFSWYVKIMFRGAVKSKKPYIF